MTEISSDVIRGYNDTIILYLLLKEPSYGYEISKKIRNLSEDKYVIKETTLYSAFTRKRLHRILLRRRDWRKEKNLLPDHGKGQSVLL